MEAVFKVVFENRKALTLNIDYILTVKVNGALTMYGITNPVNTTAVIMVKRGGANATCMFDIALFYYRISIPSIVADKINKSIAITIVIPSCRVAPTK